MGGFIDLLVDNAAGGIAVIDLKYGRYSDKRKELANNLHLQLAVYAFLVAQGVYLARGCFFNPREARFTHAA